MKKIFLFFIILFLTIFVLIGSGCKDIENSEKLKNPDRQDFNEKLDEVVVEAINITAEELGGWKFRKGAQIDTVHIYRIDSSNQDRQGYLTVSVYKDAKEMKEAKQALDNKEPHYWWGCHNDPPEYTIEERSTGTLCCHNEVVKTSKAIYYDRNETTVYNYDYIIKIAVQDQYYNAPIPCAGYEFIEIFWENFEQLAQEADK